MDYKDPDSTEEENLWLPAHTDMQTEKNRKKGIGAAVAATECAVEAHAWNFLIKGAK